MTEATIDSSQLKAVLKTVLTEILQEQRGLLYDLIVEIMEDIALTKAIEEGQDSELVTRDEVFNVLGPAE